MTAKHTPGPWHYVGGAVYQFPADADDSTRCAIATRASVKRNDVVDPFAPTEKDANMRLIAAAPGMVAELQRIAAKIDKASGSPTFTAKEHDSLLQIIAKATGREG